MIRFNSQIENVQDEGTVYKIQMETNQARFYNAIQDIIRAAMDMEKQPDDHTAIWIATHDMLGRKTGYRCSSCGECITLGSWDENRNEFCNACGCSMVGIAHG